MSNYASKPDVKNAAGVDISKLAKNVDLASLKSEVYKLDIDKALLQHYESFVPLKNCDIALHTIVGIALL